MNTDLVIGGGKFLESSVMKSFFMQIDSVLYEREKKCSYSGVNVENYATSGLSGGEVAGNRCEFIGRNSSHSRKER